jgi:hypothetical protein
LNSELLDEWQHWFGDVPPLGYLLRDVHPERWLRIHALPSAKRYATTALEYTEVLRRYNAGGDEILGDGAPIVFFLHTGCASLDLDRQAREAGLPFPLTPVTQILPDETTTHDQPLCVSGARSQWRAGRFDQFLRAVADDKVDGLVFASATGQVFAPYDGGADLFFVSELARDLARPRFADWLSGRADGL